MCLALMCPMPFETSPALSSVDDWLAAGSPSLPPFLSQYATAQLGALILEAFPPRGIIHLLEKQHTQVSGWLRNRAGVLEPAAGAVSGVWLLLRSQQTRAWPAARTTPPTLCRVSGC